jgi:hypothetical protein
VKEIMHKVTAVITEDCQSETALLRGWYFAVEMARLVAIFALDEILNPTLPQFCLFVIMIQEEYLCVHLSKYHKVDDGTATWRVSTATE